MYYAKDHVNNSNIPSMNGNGSTTKAMPNSDSNNSNNMTPPDNTSNNNSVDTTTPPDKPNGNNSSIEMPNNTSTSNITWLYYVIFAIESLIISILVIYLIMSKFNKKTFKETITNKDKLIISTLSTIILTAGLTYLDAIVTNNYFLKSNNKNQNTNMNTQTIVTYSAKEKITENKTITAGEYSSTKEDENAILVTGDIDVDISNVKLTKTKDSTGVDNTSFYGNNSAILAKSGAKLNLKNITVNTNATGANGVFCYGGSATTSNSSSDGTTVTVSDSTITTTKDNSGGIMTTGGGTTKANNLTINTSGISSAAIRSDRGGGEVNVTGGIYTTTGKGSPSIYSTANINVSKAKLISKVAEGIVIEGKNSVTLNNTTLTDTNSKLNGQSTTYKNIFLYQSMSGDADTGNSTFTAKNSKITTNKGDTLYVTNTTSVINLENNTFINNDSTANFLRAQKDSWGTSGSNGGKVTLIMKNQKAVGNIVIDSISTLNMTIKENSYYEGTINKANSTKSIKLTLSKNSLVKLTGDSYISSLNNADSTNSNIDFNGYKLYVNNKAIN